LPSGEAGLLHPRPDLGLYRQPEVF
jgi:hypothetical protein